MASKSKKNEQVIEIDNEEETIDLNKKNEMCNRIHNFVYIQQMKLYKNIEEKRKVLMEQLSELIDDDEDEGHSKKMNVLKQDTSLMYFQNTILENMLKTANSISSLEKDQAIIMTNQKKLNEFLLEYG